MSIVEDLPIVPDKTDQAPHVVVRDNRPCLAASASLVRFLRKRNIVSARAYLALLRAAPDFVQGELGLSDQQLRSYIAQLLMTLRSRIPVNALVKRKPMKVATGALRPPLSSPAPVDPPIAALSEPTGKVIAMASRKKIRQHKTTYRGVYVGKIIETDEDLMEHSYPHIAILRSQPDLKKPAEIQSTSEPKPEPKPKAKSESKPKPAASKKSSPPPPTNLADAKAEVLSETDQDPDGPEAA